MSDQLETYIFLAFIVLIPILMILTLIYLLVRMLKRKNKFARITRKLNWNKLDLTSAEMSDWNEKLKSTLFSEASWQDTIEEAWSGTIGDTPVLFARYHSRSNSPYGHLRKGDYYTLLALKKGNGKKFRIMARYGGALANIVEKISKGFWNRGESNWDWSLISSQEELYNMRFNSVDSGELQNMLKAGSFLFFYPDFTIFMAKTEVDTHVIKEPHVIGRKILELLK